VTQCTPWGEGERGVLDYLARYVFRVAITNTRIVGLDDQAVTIRHKERVSNQWRTSRIPGQEFMRRFLQQGSILRVVAPVAARTGRTRAPTPVARPPNHKRPDRKECRYRLPDGGSPASWRTLRLPPLRNGSSVACSSHRTEMGTGAMTSNASAIEAKLFWTTRLSSARQGRIARCPHRPRRARSDELCRPRTATFGRSRVNWSDATETKPDV
jgi:hypothetical protein